MFAHAPHAHFHDEDEKTIVSDGLGALQALLEAPGQAINDVPGEEWYAGVNGVPVGPMPLSELRAKAAQGAVTVDSLVWREGFDEWKAAKHYPQLAAMIEEARKSLAPVATLKDPFAGAPAGARISGVPGVPKPRKPGGVLQWVAVGVAVVFGFTLSAVLFGGQTVKTVTEYVYVEKVRDRLVAGTQPGDSTPGTAATTVGKSGGQRVPVRAGVGAAPATAEATGTATGERLALGGKKEEVAVGTQGGGQGDGGVKLSESQIAQTVNANKAGVQRRCWQRALQSRVDGGPSTAKVSVSINVTASGSVASVSTSGDPAGFPGLASCIGSSVKAWQFPASGGSTTVNTAFVFAAQ